MLLRWCCADVMVPQSQGLPGGVTPTTRSVVPRCSTSPPPTSRSTPVARVSTCGNGVDGAGGVNCVWHEASPPTTFVTHGPQNRTVAGVRKTEQKRQRLALTTNSFSWGTCSMIFSTRSFTTGRSSTCTAVVGRELAS